MPTVKCLPSRWAVAACLFACACGRPDFNTDLVEEGPPEVVLLAVPSESAGEAATFCFDGVDPAKRNLLYCPEEGGVDPVADVAPLGAYVRVAFDELLDPDIEVLVDADGNPVSNPEDAVAGSIAEADPFTITCDGEAVTYGGFYDPSGNHLTFPAGPALVAELNPPLKSGASCTVELKDVVTDKGGEPVPAAQRGPYEFSLANLAVAGTEPADKTTGVAIMDLELSVELNNHVDEASLAGKVLVNDGNADIAVTVAVSEDAPNAITITADNGFAVDTCYTVTIDAGIADVKGGALAEAKTFQFDTDDSEEGDLDPCGFTP